MALRRSIARARQGPKSKRRRAGCVDAEGSSTPSTAAAVSTANLDAASAGMFLASIRVLGAVVFLREELKHRDAPGSGRGLKDNARIRRVV